MKGAQKALMIVGEVVSILLVVVYGALFLPAALSGDLTGDNVGIKILMYFFIITMINAIFAIMGRRTMNKAILILNMITSIGSLIFLNGIGAEWGLRARKRELQNQSKEEK